MEQIINSTMSFIKSLLPANMNVLLKNLHEYIE